MNYKVENNIAVIMKHVFSSIMSALLSSRINIFQREDMFINFIRIQYHCSHFHILLSIFVVGILNENGRCKMQPPDTPPKKNSCAKAFVYLIFMVFCFFNIQFFLTTVAFFPALYKNSDIKLLFFLLEIMTKMFNEIRMKIAKNMNQ